MVELRGQTSEALAGVCAESGPPECEWACIVYVWCMYGLKSELGAGADVDSAFQIVIA